MKKILKSILSKFICCVMILSLSTLNVDASFSDTSDKIISINEEYIQEHFENLLNEIQTASKLEYSRILSTNNLVTNAENISLYKIQDNELVDKQGATTGIYAVTYAAVITDGSTNLSGYDPTIAVKCYSTIYFHIREVKGTKEYCLYKVSGGYTKDDSSTSVKLQTVTYSEGGSGSEGNVNYPVTTKSPTGSSWSYNTGYTKYVIKGGIYSGSGCAYTIKLSKGSDSWTYTLSNPL